MGIWKEQVTPNREQSPVPLPDSKLGPASLEVITLVDSSSGNIYFSNIKTIPTISSETNQSSIKAMYPIRSHGGDGMHRHGSGRVGVGGVGGKSSKQKTKVTIQKN